MKRNTTVLWLVLLTGLTAGLAQAGMYTSSNTGNGWRTSGSGYGGAWGQWTYLSQWNSSQTSSFPAGLCHYDSAVDAWKMYDYTGVADPLRSTVQHNGNIQAANSMGIAYTFGYTGTAYITGSVMRGWYSSRLFAVLTNDNLADGYDGSVASTLINDTLGDNYGFDPVWNYTTYAIPVVAGQSLVIEWTWDHRDAWWVAGGNANLTISEVPEPAALGLLALGGLVVLRRRPS